MVVSLERLRASLNRRRVACRRGLRRMYRNADENHLQPFPLIFFVMVGLSLNLRDIDWCSPSI